MKSITRSNLIKLFQNLVGLTLLAALAIYVYMQKDELSILLKITWLDLILLTGVTILRYLLGAARFASLYKGLGIHMSLAESFGLSMVISALNTIFPTQTGALARAVYLKHRYQLPYSQVPAIFLGSFVFLLLIGAGLILTANTILLLNGHPPPTILWIGALLAGTSVLLLWFHIPEKITLRLGRIGNMLRLFSDGWHKLRNDKETLIEIGVYQLLMFIGAGLGITIAYNSLNLQIGLLIGISVAVFTSISNTIIITPGNIGIQEIVFGYLSQLSGLSFMHGVAASALIRAVGLLVTFGIAPIAWYWLFFRKNIKIRKTGDVSDITT